NERVLQELQQSFKNNEDFDAAKHLYIGTVDDEGRPTTDPNVWSARIGIPPVWNLNHWSFLTPPLPSLAAPDTVNPSLWRQAKINMNNGLFEVTTRTYNLKNKSVTKGIYQVRSFDLSNMTIVEGDTGIIVIDPLISTLCAQKSLELFRHFRPDAGPVR